MAESMQALVYDRARDPWDESRGLRLMEVPKVTLNEARNPEDRSHVLIKPKYAGFCGSDRGIWYRKAFKDMILGSLDREANTSHSEKHQRIIGHELFGEVVAIGSDVKEKFGIDVGSLVSTESHIFCGECYQCKLNEHYVCADDIIIGISCDGAFAEYVKLPAKVLWPTDTSKIRPEVAAIQEPFGNAVHACTKVDLKGKRVAIFGCGTIGLFAVAVARALGAKEIIGVEPLKKHADMALKLGADRVIAPGPASSDYASDPKLVAELRELTQGIGVDVALEMSGMHSSVNNAIQSVCRGGNVILFGLKNGDATIQNFDRIIVNGINLHSVVGRRLFGTWEITKRLLESREPNIHDLIWEVILNSGEGSIVPFKDFEPERFEQAINNYPKVVLKF